jgi:hypothetical protein
MKSFTLLSLFLTLLISVSNVSAQVPIFTEGYAAGVSFAAFGGSTNNLTVDATVAYTGTSSLKIDVPAGGYTGGALVAAAQDLSAYNAVSFWVKASAAHSLNVSGLGNNGASSAYQVELNGFALTTTWTKVVIPIPNPAKFTSVTGLFHFAEGSDEGAYTIWMDDIQYETTSVGAATATMTTETVTKSIGDSFSPTGTACTFNGVTFSVMKVWFDYTSSNTAVATMNNTTGTGTAVAGGTTNITATMGATAVSGTLTVNVTAAPSGPTVAAPTPTRSASIVTSMFSGAYTDGASINWDAFHGMGVVYSEVMIAGNATKKFENLSYIGAQASAAFDVSSRTHLHLDVWTLNAETNFRVKLVDFTGGHTEHEVTLSPNTGGGVWKSYDVALSSFSGLASLTDIRQFITSSTTAGQTFWVDNVYFYTDNTPTAPTTAAPTPTRTASYVTSMFSGAYTDGASINWDAFHGMGVVYSDVTIAGNATKKFENLNYIGAQASAAFDVSSRTHLHLDVWTLNAETNFRVKLVDFTGGHTESEITLSPNTGGGIWKSYDVALSTFSGLASLTDIRQFITSSTTANQTFWVDNVYFYNEPPTTPPAAAATPTLPQANVISLLSNVYSNRTVEDWSPSWDGATYTDETIAGVATKKYALNQWAGIIFSGAANQINATNATFFHLDVWSPTAITFNVKLVDFGTNGVGGLPSDDSESELPFSIAAGEWVSLDIPFTGAGSFGSTSPNALTARAHLAQMFISSTTPSTVFLENIYFYALTVLPVELTNFKAKTVNNTTVLSWKTATETNNQGFTVERSANGTNFTAIGQVKGNGTSTVAHDYTFTDATPSVGSNYYRLRQTDLNGKETLSSVVSVLFGKTGLVLKNSLVNSTLDVTVGEESATPLSIFNVSGQLIYTTKAQGTQSIDVSRFAAGLYIIRTGTGEVSRFVKQ